MQLESLRRGRRILSAAASLAAIALVMARVSGGGTVASDAVGTSASLAFVVSLVLLVIMWRKEHAASEAAFAMRAEQQLAIMKREIELAGQRAAEGSQSNARLTPTKTAAGRTPSR